MKTNNKTIRRLFSKHIIRFFTVALITLVSISFIYGILEVESKIKTAMNDFYIEHSMHDIYIKSKKPMGFSKTDIEKIENEYGKDNIEKSFCYELEIDSKITRVYSYDLESSINQLELIEGTFPTKPNEVVVERKTKIIDGYDVGDKVSLQGMEYTVTGIVYNPLFIMVQEEPSFTDQDRPIENVIYFNQSPFMVNDISIKLDNLSEILIYSKDYEDIIDAEKEKLSLVFNEEDASILSLYENAGFFSLKEYSEKVSLIGVVFVVFFLLITVLVIYSTMSRLLDEERAQNACMKTLGFSNYQIINKYLIFTSFAIIIGAIAASIVGTYFTVVIYNAFNFQYEMPTYPGEVNIILYSLVSIAMLLVNIILIAVVALKNVNHDPAYLLRPKSPKAGKKVILERIGIIWNRLSFKYKSTCRNVLLFKSRFFMTVISIMFSTMLVLAGMGLMDCALKVKGAESLSLISIGLIVFSGVLCALVIYNITNINVSERNREIATLMVLGYRDNEVTGYIYREIYIMSAIGAIFGVPCGYLFMEFVFGLIDFGSVGDINWWTWILSPLLTMVYSVLSTMMLRKKIIKTDMNASLKILE